MNEILAREMLKDYRANVPPYTRVYGCPFSCKSNPTIQDLLDGPVYYHELCALLFPKWAKKNFNWEDENLLLGSCPCNVMTHKYVKQRIEKFMKREV